MEKFTVEFYTTKDGKSPVEAFIYGLESKMQAKLIRVLEILEEKGPTVREPYSKHLDDGIFELRCKLGSDITRVLYFFDKDRIIILTNGFVKKTQKTPRSEMNLAQQRRKDYLERVKHQ